MSVMLAVSLMLSTGCVQTRLTPPPVIPMTMENQEGQLYLVVGQERLAIGNETGWMMVDYLARLKEWRILANGN